MHGADPSPLTPQIPIPFVLMRGGTSKAVFLRGDVLPEDPTQRDAVILALFGSPDPRQIDGLGGADLLTSKLAIIDPPSRPDADLDYTFAQVSITEPVVDYDINCGNISAAVGAYAVDEGVVEAVEPTTRVRIHNTNTGRILVAEVPVVAGTAAIEGDCVVQGVPGSGAPIALDFGQTAGGVTGALLPTGNELDLLHTEIGPVEVSIVDVSNLTVFIPAAAVGLKGTELPDQYSDEHLAAIETVKRAAADLIGLDRDGLIPVPALVAVAQDFTSYASGEVVFADEVDLLARVVGGRPAVPHKAYPGTVGACTGVAARIPGTVVHRVLRPDTGREIRLGHMSGVMTVRADVSRSGEGWQVEEAAYYRTARRLAEGTAFVRARVLSSTSPDQQTPGG